MTETAYKKFSVFREKWRALAEKCAAFPGLAPLVQSLVDSRDGPPYTVRRSAVYNAAMDDIGPAAEIKLILVGDNPGRREQETGRYLVGPSGKIAEGFFKKESSLGIDFRAGVLILNKTPVHTPRTAELKTLCQGGAGPALREMIESSQKETAALLFEARKIFAPAPVWITGYSEMKKGGVFAVYTEELRRLLSADKAAGQGPVLLFRHFSMNQFTVDLNRQRVPGETTAAALARIGAAYRERVLGA